MSAYIEPIKTALGIFPLAALIVSMLSVTAQKHKYGAVSLPRLLISNLMTLYFLCAYALVILPLPEAADLTGPRAQLLPFHFIADFLKDTPLRLDMPQTYLKALRDGSFFVPVCNVFMTLPFGVYLRYARGDSLKKTVLCTFLLSLFFELTQLTGLYFIYPRGYRLFDVDDLMLNTLGGLLGYFCANHLPKLPLARPAAAPQMRLPLRAEKIRHRV